MRTGGGGGGGQLQSQLSTESAWALKQSLSLARRRGHAHVTPLHVAATLLVSSSKSTLLKSACFKTSRLDIINPHAAATADINNNNLQQHMMMMINNNNNNNNNNPFQSRALELCFNVALNRLPTAIIMTPPLVHHHHQPSLSNALIAALKRAQAHQRRGSSSSSSSIEHQQQHLLAVKVEVEQLILSILDDPSVSRVMREAGFSSTEVKKNIEENFKSFSSSSVFDCYSSNGGVYSAPPSPPHHHIPRSLNFWETPFWKQKLGQNAQFLFPNRSPPVHDSEDIESVLQFFLKKKRKNVVIIGDNINSIESLVSEIMDRIEKGDSIVPQELKRAHFIRFQFSTVPLRYMKREEVEMNMLELKRKMDIFLAGGKRVIVYTGDLSWTLVDEKERNEMLWYNPVEHLVGDIGKMISEYNYNDDDNYGSNRVWLMGSANYQTYMRCQMKQPSLEVQWCLQPVSLPSAGLHLSLHATSVQDSRVTSSQKLSQVEVDKKPFCSKEGNDKLTCCDECLSKYDKEAANFINKDLDKSSNQLPLWLQPQTTDRHKDGLIELRNKWNTLCGNQHQTKPIRNNANSQIFFDQNPSNDKSYTYPSSNLYCPKSNSENEPKSISFANSNSKPIHTPTSYPRFRRQQSCHIEFSFGDVDQKQQSSSPNLESLRNTEGLEVKTTLALGNSLISNGGKLVEKKIEVLGKLKENVPWHEETVSLIVETLYEESRLGKRETWLLIEGNDFVGKKRFASGIAESMFGSTDFLLNMNMKEKGNERNSSSEKFGNALQDRQNLVVLVENVDLADTQFLQFLGGEFQRFGEKSRKEGKSGQIICVLAQNDSASYRDDKDLNSVIQMKLEVKKIISYLGNKRKSEWDSSRKSKNPKFDEKENASSTEDMITEKVCSRQSSSNTLDLNMKAEDEDDENEYEGEISKRSEMFLENIKNRFVFNRESTQDSMIKDKILSKVTGSFEDVCKHEGHFSCVFEVENNLLEELLVCAGYFVNSQLEKWLKQVFETSLETINLGGKGGETSARLCLDTEKETESESSGYMGTCLPKKIRVSFIG